MTGLLRFYPAWWRERYGDEVAALLDDRPSRPRDGVDLLRGAVDAWIHPPSASRIPVASALVGGGLWTVVAVGVLSQPAPPDWPGYIVDVLVLALIAVASLLVALIGVAIRGYDDAGRVMTGLIALALVGYGAWMLALVGALAAITDGPTVAVAQATAMIATAGIGAALIRVGDELIGALVLVAGVTLLVPWMGAWLLFGAEWTAIGIALALERPRRARKDRGFA